MKVLILPLYPCTLFYQNRQESGLFITLELANGFSVDAFDNQFQIRPAQGPFSLRGAAKMKVPLFQA
ncbi:hypothetical protein, partial [Thiolapillus sp.]|uniref:hypothetical protein n=1 Tax=Thiolapillus sp. TaxID=2017437 RepID=UPI003AF646D4